MTTPPIARDTNSQELQEDIGCKEEVADPSSMSSPSAGGTTKKLLSENAQLLEQISANFGSNQMHENIGLFCQARDNIHQVLNNLGDTEEVMKKMPPLPEELNEELANLILPGQTFPMETMTRNQTRTS